MSWRHPAILLFCSVVLLGLIELYIESKFPPGQGGPRYQTHFTWLLMVGGLVLMAWFPLYMIACPEKWMSKGSLFQINNQQDKKRLLIRQIGYVLFSAELLLITYRTIVLSSRL
jgi:hypothetical protein